MIILYFEKQFLNEFIIENSELGHSWRKPLATTFAIPGALAFPFISGGKDAIRSRQ